VITHRSDQHFRSTQVIGQDEDDVRRTVCRIGRCCRWAATQETQDETECSSSVQPDARIEKTEIRRKAIGQAEISRVPLGSKRLNNVN
jgi:hypothetical protein